jgi:polyisoprenyl-teichoic acid--peptidoglycan teichoic acid transferase
MNVRDWMPRRRVRPGTARTVTRRQRWSEPVLRTARRALLAAGVGAAVVALLLSSGGLLAAVQLGRSFGVRTLPAQAVRLAFNDVRDLIAPTQERINIVLFGLADEARLLTDTILLISVRPQPMRVLLLSIPRDLLVPYPDGSWQKLNEAYRIGATDAPGGGAPFATEMLGSIIGVPLEHYVVVDFAGFRRVIDDLGGVRVHVDRWFADATLGPAWGPVLVFAQGWQWLDGQRALQFARSRHGNNFEGSDFARMRRQQHLLLALHERVHAPDVLLNPLAVARLAGDIGGAMRTNLEPWELVALWRLSGEVSAGDVLRTSLAAERLVVEARGPGDTYVLQPLNGDFGALRAHVARLLSS